MKTIRSPFTGAVACAVMLLAAHGAQAQAWRTAASTETTLCATTESSAVGGAGANVARDALDERGDCAGQAVQSNAFAAASIAEGFAVVSTRATGAGTDSAVARADFTDIVQIADVPAALSTVTLRVTIRLTAQGDIAPEDAGNFLFGRITVPGSGDYELRRCTLSSCPDDPIANDLLQEVITVPRLGGGEFGIIGVAANVTLRSEAGSALLRSDVQVEILDVPGARLTSASGQYATAVPADSDADLLPDSTDNCPQLANRLQRDSDGEGIGNACDPDLNNDGVVNVIDLGLLRAAAFSASADADFDGDGSVNLADVGRMRQFFFQPPGPGLPSAAPATSD